MSWDVEIAKKNDGGESGGVLEVDAHTEGGTFALGGTPTAELNITYNYDSLFTNALGVPFPSLHGKHIREVGPLLFEAAKKLGTKPAADYWKPTAGNAGHALMILANWCEAASQIGEDYYLFIY